MDCLALWAEIVEKVGPFVYCGEPVVNSKKPLPAGSGQAPGPAADKDAWDVSGKNAPHATVVAENAETASRS
jgi:hypothetical protein